MSANKLPPITVRGTVYWCERNKLNKYSNKYQVQLGNLSEKAVEAIEEMPNIVTDVGRAGTHHESLRYLLSPESFGVRKFV